MLKGTFDLKILPATGGEIEDGGRVSIVSPVASKYETKLMLPSFLYIFLLNT